MNTKRITLKNGQRVRLYCSCRNESETVRFSKALDRRYKCIADSNLKTKGSDICPTCGGWMWTFSKIIYKE
jgi:hypothetical protein